jgi:hypothetical protein
MHNWVQESASSSIRLLLTLIVVILLLTLTSNTGPAEVIPTFCLLCGSYGTADFFLNVLMFVPLGYLAARVFTNVGKALIALITFTIAIELLQFLIPGRFPTLGDVVANTLGGCLGIWALHIRMGQPDTLRYRVGLTAIRAAPLALTAVLLLTVAWFRPALPESIYYGQWTPELGQFEQYAGSVHDVYIGSVNLPGHRLDAAQTRAIHRIARGAPLTVEYLAGPPTDGLAPIFSVFDENQVEVLVVGASSDAIVIRMRRVAEALGFHAPEVKFVGLHPPEGTESAIRLTRAEGSLCVRVAETNSCGTESNPARGWRLFTGIQVPDWAPTFLDVAWLGLLGFLAVYFASKSFPGSPGWLWRTTWLLPVFAYGTMWFVFQGDPGWVPGLAGLIAGSVSAAAVR